MQPLIHLSQVSIEQYYKMDMDATVNNNMENKPTTETTSASVLDDATAVNYDSNRKYLYDLAINFDNYKPLALQPLQPLKQQTDSSLSRNQSTDSSQQQMSQQHLRGLEQFANDYNNIRSNDNFNHNKSNTELFNGNNSHHNHHTTERRSSVDSHHHNGHLSGIRQPSSFSTDSNSNKNNNEQMLLLSPTRGEIVSTIFSNKPILSTGFFTKPSPSQLPYNNDTISSSTSSAAALTVHHSLSQMLPKISNSNIQSKDGSVSHFIFSYFNLFNYYLFNFHYFVRNSIVLVRNSVVLCAILPFCAQFCCFVHKSTILCATVPFWCTILLFCAQFCCFVHNSVVLCTILLFCAQFCCFVHISTILYTNKGVQIEIK